MTQSFRSTRRSVEISSSSGCLDSSLTPAALFLVQLLPIHTLRLGVELDSFDGHHYVSSVAPGGPAEKHGVLRPEDELLEVSRITTAGQEVGQMGRVALLQDLCSSSCGPAEVLVVQVDHVCSLKPLHPHDNFLQVNGVQVYGKSRREVVSFLKEAPPPFTLVCCRRLTSDLQPESETESEPELAPKPGPGPVTTSQASVEEVRGHTHTHAHEQR